jgi:hypothetical protein
MTRRGRRPLAQRGEPREEGAALGRQDGPVASMADDARLGELAQAAGQDAGGNAAAQSPVPVVITATWRARSSATVADPGGASVMMALAWRSGMTWYGDAVPIFSADART